MTRETSISSPTDSVTAETVVDIVRKHVDALLVANDHIRGKSDPGLLVDGIDLNDNGPIRWRGFAISNLARQQQFLRTLVGLSELTGRDEYRRRACDAIRAAMNANIDSRSRMLYWGGHSCMNATTGKPMRGNHELKAAYPYYELLYEVEPEATRGAIEGMWNKHVRDWSSLLFNRHAEYNWWSNAKPDAWDHEYEISSAALPLVNPENDSSLSFITSGSDLIMAALMLSRLDNDPQPGIWACRLAGRYERMRDPVTGLGAHQFNHFRDCRVRKSFAGAYCSRPDVNEVTVLTRGAIEHRYAYAAAAFLSLAEKIGGTEGEFLAGMAAKDMIALSKHSYDAKEGYFHCMLLSGERLTPEMIVKGSGYLMREELEPVRPHGILLLAFARACRRAGSEGLMDTTLALADAMGLGQAWRGETIDLSSVPRLSPVPPNLSPDGPEPSLYEACVLAAALEWYQATGKTHALELARAVAGRLIKDYRHGDLLLPARAVDQPPAAVTLDNSIPLVLLHLAWAIGTKKQTRPPDFYPTINYFDPKVVMRKMEAVKE